MMRVAILTALSLSLVAGCTPNPNKNIFDGYEFRGRTKHVERSDRRDFTTEISPISASIEGAREAGRYEGIKYCIEQYGTSNIVWTSGPDEEPQTWAIDRDSVTFAGRCTP